MLAFHTGAGWAVGGFLGVDLFFVLSGFLITVLLVNEWQRRRADQPAALLRPPRAAAAARPSALMCAVLLIVGPVAHRRRRAQRALERRRRHVFYFANWQQAFGLLPLFQLTDHTWSLAIEEQFYLVWPPLLLADHLAGPGDAAVTRCGPR